MTEPRYGRLIDTDPYVRVSGERGNIDYVLDTRTGHARRINSKRGEPWKANLGLGRPCVRAFVAVYVDPASRQPFVQVGSDRVAVDGSTDAHHRLKLGVFSTLTVLRDGQAVLKARQRLPLSAFVQRLVDPAYDELDLSLDDFLMDVADLVTSSERLSILGEARPERGEI